MPEPLNKQIPGVTTPDPTFVDSRDADALEKFAAIIPPHAEDEEALFGRAPLETRITVGHFRDIDRLKAAVHAFVNDISKRLHDEYVVKTLFGRSITVGDLRDFAEKNPLKVNKADAEKK